jgi:hypothetical protein
MTKGLMRLTIAMLPIAGCAPDAPPIQGRPLAPADALARFQGTSLISTQSQAGPQVNYFESTERLRYRIRLASTGQVLTDTARLTTEGEAVCVVFDMIFPGRKFCGVWQEIEGGFRTVPTDGRPSSVFRQVPGNPEGV